MKQMYVVSCSWSGISCTWSCAETTNQQKEGKKKTHKYSFGTENESHFSLHNKLISDSRNNCQSCCRKMVKQN